MQVSHGIYTFEFDLGDKFYGITQKNGVYEVIILRIDAIEIKEKNTFFKCSEEVGEGVWEHCVTYIETSIGTKMFHTYEGALAGMGRLVKCLFEM